MNKRLFSFLILFLFGFGHFTTAQTQSQLEAQRLAVEKEIKQINDILSSNKKEQGSLLDQATYLDEQIRVTEKLIKVNNQEANLLTTKINENAKKIDQLRNELEVLKKDYAKMIVKSYQSRSNQNRIMFLFSSENFRQAYKRIQYMKQIADYREKQGERIAEQTVVLEELNTTLFQQKKNKDAVLAKNRLAKTQLLQDKKEQEALIVEIQKDEKKYIKEIQNKQKEITRIDKEIDNLIKTVIVTENKKRGSTASSVYKLTPAGESLAKDFEKNKGKLPWPVERGLLSMRFGVNKSHINKNLKMISNGIRIETEENAVAKSIFEGEVVQITLIRGANKMVLVRHGNYLSIYRNLTHIYVKPNQKIKAGDKIGEIGKDPATGKTVLSFVLAKNATKLDPADWIMQM